MLYFDDLEATSGFATDMAVHPYLQTSGPIAFAHRGGAAQWPENTVEAFKGAYELGFRYMETDVHLAADGTVVAFHDPRLERVAGVDQSIRDTSWPELEQMRVNNAGRIPTMAGLLERFPDVRFNIDMKSDEVLEPLVDLIKRHSALERVCLASFYERRITRAKSLAGPGLCTSAGTRGVVRHMLYSVGMVRRSSRSPILQVPMQRHGVPVVTKRFVRAAHRLGIAVHVWTIDDSDEMHRLLDMRVDGIMTDQPQVLKRVFRERNIWQE